MTHIELGRIIAPAQLQRAGREDYPVLSMTMRNGLVDQSDKFKKRVASADTSQYKVVRRNQLVVGFPIDEGVLAFQRLYDKAIVSPAYNVWNLQDGVSIDSKYLERFLRSPLALFFYKSKLRSTTARRRTLPDDVFLSLSVPVPPLSRQERILKLLDEADDLRQLRAQADRRTAALIPALFHEMFGDPASNAKGWPKIRLGDLVLPTEQRDPRENPTEKFSYVDIASVDNKAKVIAESKEIIGFDAPSRARKVIRTGDVIVSTVRPNLNAVARIPSGLDNQICSTGFSVLRPSEKIISEYVFAFVTSSFFVDCLVAKTTGANYPSVNDGEIKGVLVSVPPLSLQKEFAQRATELRELEAAQSQSRQRLDDLFQSMLHRAFNGDL